MITVKSHKRKRRNGVSVIRQHLRKSGITISRSHAFNRNRFEFIETGKGKGDVVVTYPFGAKYRYIDVPESVMKIADKDTNKALALLKSKYTYMPENKVAQTTFSRAQKNRRKKK